MSRFYRIQIDTIYLTSDGTSGGIPKLTVQGVEDLLTTITGSVFPTIGGGSIKTLAPWTKDKQFDVQIEVLMKDQWDALVDLLNGKLEADDDFIVTGTGDIGDFSVTVKPFPRKPFAAKEFLNGIISGANFKFITV
jgi:hypothetical protein